MSLTYTELDERIHQLCQTIAKANRTFVTPKEDDSHTNLAFDSTSQRIYGRWISRISGSVILALNLKTWTFEWLDESLDVLLSVDIANKYQKDVEQEINSQLREMDLLKEGFAGPLHFDIPKYEFAEEKITIPEQEVLRRWIELRGLANQVSHDFLDVLQQTTEVRIWPHHFDTGIYVEKHERMGYGFGWAMKDSMIGEPYYYLSGYALRGELNYSKLSELDFGFWKQTEHWKGAVLPLETFDNVSIVQARSLILSFSESVFKAISRQH